MPSICFVIFLLCFPSDVSAVAYLFSYKEKVHLHEANGPGPREVMCISNTQWDQHSFLRAEQLFIAKKK